MREVHPAYCLFSFPSVYIAVDQHTREKHILPSGLLLLSCLSLSGISRLVLPCEQLDLLPRLQAVIIGQDGF
jgi:hypothetical protein